MIFSIESSSSSLSLALLSNMKVINQMSVTFKNGLSEIIIPTIKTFLLNSAINFNNISILCIGCGPGSFTGIRTVVSAAKGIQTSNINIKSIGINSLAGLAMSVLNEAKGKNIKYVLSSIDSKRGDAFIQLYKINNLDIASLPFSAINEIKAIKIENLNKYISINKLNETDILFVGHQSKSLKNKIKNLKISDKLDQNPNALWVAKLTFYLVNKKIDTKSSNLIFNNFKPIYVRYPQIN